jgi:hypothetical protein
VTPPTDSTGDTGEVTPPTDSTGDTGEVTPPTDSTGDTGEVTPPTDSTGDTGEVTPPTDSTGDTGEVTPPTDSTGDTGEPVTPPTDSTGDTTPQTQQWSGEATQVQQLTRRGWHNGHQGEHGPVRVGGLRSYLNQLFNHVDTPAEREALVGQMESVRTQVTQAFDEVIADLEDGSTNLKTDLRELFQNLGQIRAQIGQTSESGDSSDTESDSDTEEA